MGVFAKLNGAKVFGGGVYFLPGEYVVEVENIKVVPKRKGGSIFVAETKILASDNDKRPVGSRVNYAMNLDNDSAPSNILAFMGACVGRDPYNEDEMNAPDEDGEPVDWDAVGEMAIDQKEQPFKGTKLRIMAIDRVKKDKDEADPKNHYTACKFQPVTD